MMFFLGLRISIHCWSSAGYQLNEGCSLLPSNVEGHDVPIITTARRCANDPDDEASQAGGNAKFTRKLSQ